MEAKEATADNMLAQADLATSIEPVTTAFTELKTELIEKMQPAIESVSESMTDALEWAKEHPTAMKAIAGAVAVLAIGLTGLATAAAIYTAVQWAMNSAILANPITWIVMGIIAAIAALVAIIIVVIDYWDKIVAAVKKACNSLKNAVKKAFDTMKEKIRSVMNTIKTTVSNIWNGIKTAITKVVESIKSKISSIWNGIKTATSNAFNNVKSTATSVFNKVKTAITKPIETAKNKVKDVVDSIKGFFKNMKLSFPKIKMPHFKITGEFSIKKRTVPKLDIEWYAQGGIMTRPTIFGMNGNSLMAGGEAGPEAILPISKLEDYIDNAFQRNVAYAGATYNFYLDNATVNDNAEMRSVAKDFITKLVRLGGMNR
jgi:phage-related minor tail protein